MSARKRVITAIVGLLFLAGCAWFITDAMGFDFFRVNSAWAFIIVGIGFVNLFSGSGWLFNIALMLLGGGILARDNGWLGSVLEPVSVWQMIVSLLLLVVGLSIIGSALGIGKNRWKKHIHTNKSHVNKHCGQEGSAVFGEQNFDYSGQEFRGIDLNGIFGSVVLDLREAIILEDCEIDANSVFGSVEIITGSNANYVVEGAGVFGSVDDHTNHVTNDALPTVTIKAASVFGSVDVR